MAISGSDSTSISSQRQFSPARFGRRWWIGPAIVGIGAILQAVALAVFSEDPTFSKFSFIIIWPTVLLGLLLWWIFGLRLSRRTRWTPVGILAGTAAVLAAVFRVDGSYGDMSPIINYRWTPTPAAKAKAYWQDQQSQLTATAATAKPIGNDAAGAGLLPDGGPLEVKPKIEAGQDDWPAFRGPLHDGKYRGSEIHTDWQKSLPRELWRHPVGLGWSTFAVVGQSAITMEQRDADECLVSYHLETGKPQWIHAENTRFTAVAVNGGDGPHTTPVIDGHRTYALGATGILNCVETATGKSVWRRNILEDAGATDQPAADLEWGVSAAPFVYQDLVITIPGGTQGRSVIAYHKVTGDIVWSAGEFPASYCSARVEELAGQPQLLVFHGAGLTSMIPETGAILWTTPFENLPKVNAAQPIKVDDAGLVIASGYGMGAMRLNLQRSGEKWTVEPAWKSTRFKLKFNDALLMQSHLYGLDEGILTCLDPATGKTRWKAKRMGYGQLLGVGDDQFLVTTEDGDVVLVAVNPEKYQELGRFHAVDGTTWNHPVIANKRLLIRNGTEAVCYDVSPVQ